MALAARWAHGRAMSSSAFARPAGLRASDADREAVLERVKAAYAEGRLDDRELDRRLGAAMTARTVAELEMIWRDLCPQPPTPWMRTRLDLERPSGEERVVAAVAAASSLVPVVIPAAAMLLTVGRGSPYVRHHAAGALNLQLTLIVLMMVTFGIGSLVLPVVWLLALVGVVVALSGRTMRYPWVLRLFGRRGPYPT